MTNAKDKNIIRGRRGYDFNAEFMNRAFALYCQGLTATAIAERLRSEYPSLCRQTVSRIIEKYHWEDARQRFLELKIDGASERENMAEELKAVADRLKILIDGGSNNHQHFAQWLRTKELLAKLAGFMDGSDDIVLANDQEMQAYIDALVSDEVVGPALKKRKRQIKAALQRKLEEAGIEKKA